MLYSGADEDDYETDEDFNFNFICMFFILYVLYYTTHLYTIDSPFLPLRVILNISPFLAL